MSEVITDESTESLDDDVAEAQHFHRFASAQGYDNAEEILPIPQEAQPEAEAEPPADQPEPEAVAEESEPVEEAPPKEATYPIDAETAWRQRVAKREAKAAEAEAQPQPVPVPPKPEPPTPAQQPDEQPNPLAPLGDPPDITKDPRGLVKWQQKKIQQQDMVLQMLVQDRVAQQQAADQQRQQQAFRAQQEAWVGEIGQAEDEWAKQNPDYPQIYANFKQGLRDTYTDMYGGSEAVAALPEEQRTAVEGKISALVSSELHGMARFAYDEKIHPAKVIMAAYSRMGGPVPTQTPQPAPRVRNAQGQFTAARAAKEAGEISMSQAAGSQDGTPTVQDIVDGRFGQKQVNEVLTKGGPQRMLAMLREAERNG